MDAPERIWIEDEFGNGHDDQWVYGTWDIRQYLGYQTEYIRADLHQAALDTANARAWADYEARILSALE